MNSEQVGALKSTASLQSRCSRRVWFASMIGATVLTHMANRGVGPAVWANESLADPNPIQSFRVRTVLELSGEVRLKNQGPAPERRNGKQLVARTAPVHSSSTLDYEEQYRLASDGSDECLQYFHEAKSEVNVDGHITKTELREPCREIVKRANPAGMVTASPSHPLFAAERDLIEGSLTTMYTDQCLTQQDVGTGDQWSIDSVVAAKLLNLDAVHEGKLTVTLVKLEKGEAHLALEGRLTGSVRNVSTELAIEGKGILDRQKGYLSWLALQIEETREIGEAEPGFKVTATIRVLRAPVDTMSNGRTVQEAIQEVTDWDAAGMLQFQSDHGFYRFMADRRWTTYRDNGEEATLRFIVGNRRVAQCNIANLIDFEPGRQLSLEGFQTDVAQVVSKGGHEILEASEKLSSSKHRLLGVTVGGNIEGVPVRWIYYHVSNDQGRRLTMNFTLDEASLDTFADQDQQLVNTMELLAWPSKLDREALEKSEPRADSNSASQPRASKAR